MIARLRSFYFLAYAGVGVWLAYFAPYLRGLGFSGGQIGAVSMAQMLVSVPASLLWGAAGDRWTPLRALRICSLGAALAVVTIPFARTPLQMGCALVLTASFGGGIVPLVDATAVSLLGGNYSRTRLFGSLGFVVSAPLIGFLLTARGERPADPAMPVAYLLCIAGYALVARSFPVPPANRTATKDSPPAGAWTARPHWREAFSLLRSGPLVFLLAVCALHWGTLAPYHLLFGVLVRERGHASAVAGVAMGLGVIAEVAALALFPRLERRFSMRVLFGAAFGASIVRWALLARVETAAALTLLQLLHAFSFGLFWACAVEAMQRVVPARLRATGQALFSAVVFSGGNALGAGLAGYGADRFGSAAPLFSCAALVEFLPLALLLLPLTPEKKRA